MKARRFRSSLVALLAAVLVTATPAQAASYQWSRTQMTLSPTIYQTNFTYYTAAFVPPATVDPAGVIVQTYHRWRVWDGPGTNGTLRVNACTVTTNLCVDVTGTPQLVQSSVGPYYETSATVITSAFAGLPANTQIRYSLRVESPVTKTLPRPIESSRFELSVDWTKN